MSTVRVVAWAFSEQGRAIVAGTIAAIAVLSLLRSHQLPEARELAVTIVVLLAFLIFAVVRTEAEIDAQKCAQSAASLVKLSAASA
jgi:hypothetical protein